jgi:hypothetical protein
MQVPRDGLTAASRAVAGHLDKNSRVARATAKHKSTLVVADAGRVPEIAGREVEKRFKVIRVQQKGDFRTGPG